MAETSVTIDDKADDVQIPPARPSLSTRDEQFLKLLERMSTREYYQQAFNNGIKCTIFEKVFFDRYKSFVKQSRRDEFVNRLQHLDFKSQRTRPLRKAFDRLKVNSLGKEVQAYTQDKFQYYLKYVRKLCNILNTSGLSDP